jgi:cyclopropane-fatty-acyl-phospholipid synthase
MVGPVLLETFYRHLIRQGCLTIIDADGRAHVCGSGSPAVTVRLHDASLHWKLILRPEISAGEAYMEGTLTIEDGDLYDLVDLVALNMKGNTVQPATRLLRSAEVFRRLQQFNPIKRSHQNVSHHYDLTGGFYRLFLDADMQYSCAYFRRSDDTLETAQMHKKRRLAAKLYLRPGQRVLDIGCGWGGLALSLAEAADVEVVGLTLSNPQLETARFRAAEKALDDRVHFLAQDYRQHQGKYDRVVSVGMFEHVGINHYRAFFDRVARLLADDGVAVLHTIGRAAGPGTTDPWIQRYIFPGGYSPALSEVLPHIERAGLWVTDVEVLRLHYAETLRHWRMRFLANRAKVADLHNDAFARMWEYYLVVSEIAFRRLDSVVFQIQLSKSQTTLPLTRDYIRERESEIADSVSGTRRQA